ncbi:MAG TPA: hypothetical protein VIF64_18920 [Pyrinomonadaceae bacterium]|jgi:hypothetical protein
MSYISGAVTRATAGSKPPKVMDGNMWMDEHERDQQSQAYTRFVGRLN